MIATGIASALIVATSWHGVTEDSPAWDCTTMGNMVCGPANTQGVQAGCYDDHGSLVAPWPCYTVVRPDGGMDVYVP